MSAGKSRVTAEKRIRGLFMPRKTGTSVKTISLILAGVLGLACFTTACQPTPEEPVVIGKGDGKLEEIIHLSRDLRKMRPRIAKSSSPLPRAYRLLSRGR